MSQKDRMNSAANAWEADPWDAADELADFQLTGFKDRAAKPIVWTSVRDAGESVFGIDVAKLTGADVEFVASLHGEEMLLMQLSWHGFPDPPEWRLATRPQGNPDAGWSSWGYFAEPPACWTIPKT